MIILFGNVGSGKGTQARLLADRLKCPVLSTGQMLRQNMNQKIKTTLDLGRLISDDILLPMVERELSKINAAHNEFILDGFPRRIDQAKWLVDKIKKGKLKFTAALRLNISEATALARLSLRGRHDDTSEGIKQRFAEYQGSVIPAVEYLRSQGFKIIEINGERPPKEVEASIQQILETKHA